ncbi:unnamed protein product [Amoebophrya sp. A120]|nr:unnamed protein product [Amoebophrya sp. A120]|eukprot:GSA120T00016871001.1
MNSMVDRVLEDPIGSLQETAPPPRLRPQTSKPAMRTRAVNKSPQRPGTAHGRYQVLKAGPTMGANMVTPLCKTHVKKPPPFNNFLVFVVDVEDAERMQAAKTVQELSEDILDALGLKLPHGKELQAIYSGYEGPERISISSDGDLVDYYARFSSSGNENEDSGYDARKDPELQDVIRELEKMRLGGILTKMQMTKYLRLLGDSRMFFLKTQKELSQTREELFDLQESMPAKIELAAKRAVDKREAELFKQFEQEKATLLAKIREETQKMIGPLRDAAEKSKAALKELQKEYQNKKAELSKTQTKLEGMEETVRTADSRAQELGEQLRAAEQQIAEDAARKTQLEQQLAEAIDVIDSNGLERPGSSSSSGEQDGGKNSKNKFLWNIPKIQTKVSWPRERSICSSDKKLQDLSSVVIEFYPGGVEASFPGYCALRLHVPDRTRLKWSVIFGKNQKTHDCGQRSDDFAKDLWWCRNGILWPNVCKLEDIKRNIDRETDSIQLAFEALTVSQLPVAAADASASRSKSLGRPRTASANFASRGNLIMEEGQRKKLENLPPFDKSLVKIFYDAELLNNAWLQDFVAGWLAQKRFVQHAKQVSKA